jgi:hypothetical protein
MDKYLCCGRERTTDARFCEACIEVAVDELVEQATREARASELAAALGPWGRFRLWFGSWLSSISIAYWGAEQCRWWHGGRELDRPGRPPVPLPARTRLSERL